MLTKAQIAAHFSLNVLLIIAAQIDALKWGYEKDNGPSTWGGRCRNGTRQSPINIRGKWFKTNSRGKITFTNYDQSGPVTVVNNGHSVIVGGFAQWAKQPYITGGGLNSKYLLEQFHFHWNHQQKNGSEHTVDGKFYDAEVHFVHAKAGRSFAEALSHSDGIAVLGIFLKVQEGTASTLLDALEDELSNVVDAGATSELYVYNIGLLHLPPPNPSKYFRYNGSLTTPNCDEVVLWTVFAEPLPITSAQLDLLHAIHGTNGEPLKTNVRPVQAN